MTTCGLVLTVDLNSAHWVDSLRAIREAGPFTIGEQIDRMLTLALESADSLEAERWHQWLVELPGIMKVDIAFVHLGEESKHVE